MVQNSAYSLLSDRILIPEGTKAILWDMDGVLIDSLGLDYKVCNELVQTHFGEDILIPDAFIQSIFAYHPPEFWKRIVAYLQSHDNTIQCEEETFKSILETYEKSRQGSVFDLNPGIMDILMSAQVNKIKMAVVSNNPTMDVEELLEKCGIIHFFDEVIGNDKETLSKKPAPDTYLLAAKNLGFEPKDCMVVEDSLIGVEAGFRAGCHTVAVATGGEQFSVLSESNYSNQTYQKFTPIVYKIQFGDVKNKRIITANDFVSHMIEHIMWRLGMQIDLDWNNDNWIELGKSIGEVLYTLPRKKNTSATLGMIDDGSAEIFIDMNPATPGVLFKKIKSVNLDWFFSLRCEQIQSANPLLDMLNGLAHSLRAAIHITICSAEDPHHTWEGVFRSIGVALKRLEFIDPPHPKESLFSSTQEEIPGKSVDKVITILEKSTHHCKISRKTAESDIELTLDFSHSIDNKYLFNVSDSIKIDPFSDLLERLALEAGFSMQLNFQALALSSSHVVLEDTALVLGKALLEILTLRMESWGVNCSGSSVQTPEDLENQSIRLGLSVEGRKFCLFSPLNDAYSTLRETFLVGQTVLKELRSEDLDDFLDGLSGGMSCSIIVHFHKIPSPDQGWVDIFSHIGVALKETFSINPNRKGVPSGVKATLL